MTCSQMDPARLDQAQQVRDNSERDLLIILADLNPVWWGLDGGAASQWSLKKCLESVMALANSHVMMRSQNEVAVLGVTTEASHFLYPTSQEGQEGGDGGQSGEDGSRPQEGKCELFDVMNEAMKRAAQALVGAQASLRVDLSLAGAIAKALCYFQRRLREEGETSGGTERASRRMRARILVIKGSEDNPSQYMALMNAVFTAQKLQVSAHPF